MFATMQRILVRSFVVVSLGSGLAFGGMASANVFEAADALFAARGEGRSQIAAARAEYKRVLATVSGTDAVYAVQQLGKLAYYEGELVLPGGDGPSTARTAVFQDCREFVESIASIEAGRTQYHYWKLLCTAFWVRHAPRVTALFQIAGIRRYFDSVVGDDLDLRAELALDSRYLGGGLYRVLAGVYRDDLASLLRSSLPNREVALEWIDRSLAAAAFPGDPNSGDMYYANVRGRGDILIRLGRTAEARELLTAGIAEIDELIAGDALPEGLEAESRGEQQIMRTLLGGL